MNCCNCKLEFENCRDFIYLDEGIFKCKNCDSIQNTEEARKLMRETKDSVFSKPFGAFNFKALGIPKKIQKKLKKLGFKEM